MVLLIAFPLAGCGSGSDEPAATEAPATTSPPATSAPATGSPAEATTSVAIDEPSEELVAATADAVTTTEAVTATQEEVTTTAAAQTAAPAPGGPPVPAFTLELDDGTTFVTTEASGPVFYYFWAEW